MAEDDTNPDLAATDDELEPEQQRPAQKKRQRRQQSAQKRQARTRPLSPKEKCHSRIDELATPSRRLILALYQEHAAHLPKDKVEKVKEMLQELYAMTPDETEKYFEHLRNKAQEVEQRKDIKYMLKKLVKRRKKAKQIAEAYKFIRKLLIEGIEYASKHPIPPLVSVRLRNLSNIILEQICDLRNTNIPNREDPTQAGLFFIQVADWMAISIEHLYYGVQLKKNRELEKIENEAKAREKEKAKSDEIEKEKIISEADNEGADVVISEPVTVSEIE
ncbi:unnamed protein product [Ceutorhynchus assimilis]|uniref:Uncharacterized protein n=1 Tax=Ceutorhynchus assimilis TaxID=467358 RepID=A0A9N9QM34_9CUCU|nr:unnamed protein product [Ceutorhynchus assimilis]